MTATAQRSGARFGVFSQLVGRLQERVREAIVPLDEVVRALPHNQVVLDIGCGEGLMIKRIIGDSAEVVGVDIDERKIARVRARFAGASNLSLHLEDAMAFLARTPEGRFNAAVLVDALSAFAQEQQLQLLREALRVLSVGGTLVIKANDGSVPFKSRLSKAISGFVCRGLKLSLSAGQQFTYLPASTIAACLSSAGAEVEIRHLHRERFHPLPHILIVARKKRPSSS